VQHQEKLTGERAIAKARLSGSLPHELASKASQAERQLPTFTKDSQNVAVVATLLDALLAPSTNGAGEVYWQLNSILGAATAQQVESSLLHWVEASILPLVSPKDGG
jgi:hypothetical protein